MLGWAGVAMGAPCPWHTVRMAPLGAAGTAASISEVDSSDVWAVGFLERQSGAQRAFAQHFDGTAWVSTSVPGLALTAVRAFSATDAWAVGYRSAEGLLKTLALHWDGSVWTIVPSPNQEDSSNVLSALAGSSSRDMWAVGSYFDPDNQATRSLAEHWNGRRWSIVPTVNVDLQNVLDAVFAASTTDVWAVGFHDDARNTDGAPLIEHWDGAQWNVVAPPMTPFGVFSALDSIDGSSPDDIWAVGDGFRRSRSPSQTLTMHWDGSAWTFVPSPNAGLDDNVLEGVAVRPKGAVAVGSSSAGRSALVERWTGSKWFIDCGALSPKNSQLNGVSFGVRGELGAVGYAATLPFDEFGCGG
jgi:hypothetical protein